MARGGQLGTTSSSSPWGDPRPAAGLRRTDFQAAIRENRRNTFWLCALLLAIGALLGYAVGWAYDVLWTPPEAGEPELPLVTQWAIDGAVFMSVFGAVWVVAALKFGDGMVVEMIGAKPVPGEAEPVLHNVVEEMAIAAGLPKPRVVVIETPALNAFATGMRPEKATVGVTRGLLERLSRDELQGVVGHEMAHVANADTRYLTAVAVLVGLIALVGDFALRTLRFGAYGHGGRRARSRGGGAAAIAVVVLLVAALLAPLAAKLVQMAVSREREYLADATAVRFTRHPMGLIGALEKIEASTERFAGANRAVQHLFIVNPVRHFGERAGALFATHPATRLRIERLRNLGA